MKNLFSAIIICLVFSVAAFSQSIPASFSVQASWSDHSSIIGTLMIKQLTAVGEITIAGPVNLTSSGCAAIKAEFAKNNAYRLVLLVKGSPIGFSVHFNMDDSIAPNLQPITQRHYNVNFSSVDVGRGVRRGDVVSAIQEGKPRLCQ